MRQSRIVALCLVLIMALFASVVTAQEATEAPEPEATEVVIEVTEVVIEAEEVEVTEAEVVVATAAEVAETEVVAASAGPLARPGGFRCVLEGRLEVLGEGVVAARAGEGVAVRR